MAVNLGDKPLAGFTQPIELMKDCHRRIEHFLGVLRTVTVRFGQGELTAEARSALAVSLRYFCEAAPRHTADEEQSLFPRLLEATADRALTASLDRLEQDHRQTEAWHADVEQLVRQWLEAGRIADSDRALLQTRLDELTAAYGEHIRLEEEEVFVHAAQILNADQLRAMGREMQQRRGLAAPTPFATPHP